MPSIQIGYNQGGTVDMTLYQLESEKDQPLGYAGLGADGYLSVDLIPAVYELTANKGEAGGYASLGIDGLVPIAQLPNTFLSDYVGGLNYVSLGPNSHAQAAGTYTSIGAGAGQNAAGSARFTAIGSDAANQASTVQYYTAIGHEAGYLGSGGTTAVGEFAARNSQGSFNVAIGNNTGGNALTAQGYTAVGYSAGQHADNDYTTFVGYEAGENLRGRYATAIGYRAGQNAAIIAGDVESSVFIGTHSGFNAEGANGIYLGNRAGYNETESNKLHIANHPSFTVIEGTDINNSLLASVRLNGDLQTLTHTDGALVVDGGVGIGRNLRVGGSIYQDGNLILDESQRNQELGFAGLDYLGKILSSQLPDDIQILTPSVYVVANEAQMLALGAKKGDFAVRSDTSQTFILRQMGPEVLSNWEELLSTSGQLDAARNITATQDIDWTVSFDGSANVTAAATIANNAVTFAKLQDLNSNVLIGSVAGGNPQEISCTAAGRALLDDANAGTQRATLGLGSMAVQNVGTVGITGGTITGITDLAIADGGTGASTVIAALTNLGLENVDNTSDLAKPISTLTQAALDLKADAISNLTLGILATNAYRGDYGNTAYLHSQAITGNPHAVTASDVGLGNVNNTSDAAKPISTLTQTALDGKQPLDAELTALAGLVSAANQLPLFTGSGTASLLPISAYVQGILDDADAPAVRTTLGLGTSAVLNSGVANGVATLDALGKLVTSQLPGSVDEIIEAANFAALPATGEISKIYVTIDNNLTFRWSGTAYVGISSSLALGTTAATAYRGDYGNIAYLHSLELTGNPHAVTASDVGLGNVNNTSDLAKPISTLTQAALDLKADASSNLTLGILATNAYQGDLGNTAYLHSQAITGNPHAVTAADVGLGNVNNTSDAAKPISTLTQTALDGKQPLDAELTAISGLISAANTFPLFTGSGTAALGTVSTAGLALIDDADAAAQLTTLGIENVVLGAGAGYSAEYLSQAEYDAIPVKDPLRRYYITDGNSTLSLANISDAGSMASQSASSVFITGGSVTGITDLTVADGGTGASTADAARTNLGVVSGVFTPSLRTVGDASQPFYNGRSGAYLKWDKLVYVQINIVCSSNIALGTGNLQITGLPFTNRSSIAVAAGRQSGLTGITAGLLNAFLPASSNAIQIETDGAGNAITFAAIVSDSTISLSLSYLVA